MSAGRTLKLCDRLDRDRLTADGKFPADPQDISCIDLGEVERIDVAGIAYVAELIARIEAANGKRPLINGEPRGLADLARAYRIKPDFSDFP